MAKEDRYETRIEKRHTQVALTDVEPEQISAAGGPVDPGGANN